MDQLKRLRIEKGLSQVRLAARAEVDPSTVNQIERGVREASPATIRKLADALGVSLAELLEDPSPKAEPPLWSEEDAGSGAQVTVDVDHLDAVLAETVRQQREFRLHELNLKLARATTEQERVDAYRNLRNWWTGMGHVLINLYQQIPELMDGALVHEEALTVERVKEFARSVFMDESEQEAELRSLEVAFEVPTYAPAPDRE